MRTARALFSYCVASAKWKIIAAEWEWDRLVGFLLAWLAWCHTVCVGWVEGCHIDLWAHPAAMYMAGGLLSLRGVRVGYITEALIKPSGGARRKLQRSERDIVWRRVKESDTCIKMIKKRKRRTQEWIEGTIKVRRKKDAMEQKQGGSSEEVRRVRIWPSAVQAQLSVLLGMGPFVSVGGTLESPIVLFAMVGLEKAFG